MRENLSKVRKFGKWSEMSEIILPLIVKCFGVMSSSKLFIFSKEVHLNSGVRLLLELYCAIVTKHVAHGSADLHSPIHPVI